MAEPIVNPPLPFVGEIPSGLQPGKMIRFQGVTHPNSDRFNINFATGPNSKPRDDTALHISVRLNQGYIARNTYKDGTWGDEQGSGKLPIGQAQSFEMIILVDPHHYKVAVNGQHFCEFPHRISYQEVTHLLVDGDVSLTLISFEGIVLGSETATQASNVNAEGPQAGPPPQFGGPQYGPPPGSYGPPPNYGGYGPPPPPGAQQQSEFAGFFDKAQEILAGAIASGAAEKIMSSILPSGGQSNQPQGYAPQNARYGIYPDLPTQETTQLPPQSGGPPNPQDSTLSDLIAGSGGTIISGPQPTLPPSANQPNPSADQGAGSIGSLLMGLMGGNGGDNRANQPQNAQSGGADVLSGILSSFLSNQGQPQNPAAPPPAQTGQGQGLDLSGILSGLLSSNNQQGGNQPVQPQNPAGPAQSGQGLDLSGILSGLLSSNNQQGGNQPVQPQNPTGPAQSGQGLDLSGILSGLLASNNQPGGNQPQSQPPQSQAGGDVLSGLLSNILSSNQNQQNPQQTQTPQPTSQNTQTQGQAGGANIEMLTSLLQGLIVKAKEQHDNTRPIQETNPTGDGAQLPPQNPNLYGQYPHPQQQQQQQQQGPVESLLSGLLSGGHQQQPHGPQVGGEGSVGGLGSVGGILGSLAGSLLHRPDNH